MMILVLKIESVFELAKILSVELWSGTHIVNVNSFTVDSYRQFGSFSFPRAWSAAMHFRNSVSTIRLIYRPR